MTIHDKVRDGLSIAKIYADDGAFRTAAARLRRLADDLDDHATWADGGDGQRVIETDDEKCERIGAEDYRRERGS